MITPAERSKYVLFCIACGRRGGVDARVSQGCHCREAYLTRCPKGAVFVYHEERR